MLTSFRVCSSSSRSQMYRVEENIIKQGCQVSSQNTHKRLENEAIQIQHWKQRTFFVSSLVSLCKKTSLCISHPLQNPGLSLTLYKTCFGGTSTLHREHAVCTFASSLWKCISFHFTMKQHSSGLRVSLTDSDCPASCTFGFLPQCICTTVCRTTFDH